MEKIDLGEVVSGVVNNFAQVRDRALNIHFSPVKDCWVEANYLLKEIFINLIGDAIKHSNGPLDVFIIINKVISDDIRYYAVTVEDNGPGIADEMKSKLFSRLNCEEMKTHDKGLGLCLVKALVDVFHGKVQVEDRVPDDHTKGVRFAVILPTIEK
jgi:signal transduction histidine kinase